MCIIPPQAPPAEEDYHHSKQKALEIASKRLGWMEECRTRHRAVVCDDELLLDPTFEMDSELCSELEIPVISLQMGSARRQPWKGDALLCSTTPAPRHARGGSSSSGIFLPVGSGCRSRVPAWWQGSFAALMHYPAILRLTSLSLETTVRHTPA